MDNLSTIVAKMYPVLRVEPFFVRKSASRSRRLCRDLAATRSGNSARVSLARTWVNSDFGAKNGQAEVKQTMNPRGRQHSQIANFIYRFLYDTNHF